MASSAPPCLAPADLESLPPLSTVEGVAEFTHTHQRTVRRWLAERRIRAVKAGRRVLIPKAELIRFLEGNP
jgi:excisionase family DNA binding protein